jgi:hypothetical protein
MYNNQEVMCKAPEYNVLLMLQIVLCCFALAAAKPTLNYPAALTVVNPVSLSSQYHVQDTLGQYTYGYSAGSSAKAESKTVDGVVRGGYSYLDGNGIVQSASYIADDVNGFRVAATNLPNPVVYDTPEVAAAKVAHSVAYNKAAYEAAVSPDVGEAVVVPAAVVSSYVASPPAAPSVTQYSVPVSPVVGFVKEAPSKAFSYSTVSTSPSVGLVSAPAGVSYSVAAENVPVVSLKFILRVTLIIIGFIGNTLQFQSKNSPSRNFQLSQNTAVTSLSLAVIMEIGDSCGIFIALDTTVNNFLSIIIYVRLFKSQKIQYIEKQ